MRLTKAQRAELRCKFGGRCAYCGQELGERWHADHFEAVERKMAVVGRKFVSTNEMYRPENDTFANLMPSCAPCNISKATLTIDNWRDWLRGHVDALNRNNTPYRLAKAFGLIEETGRPIVFYFEVATQGAHHE